ncbi:MAG: hypothetical protein IPG93_24435 [Burkholderiales bacterium]|nr:hypothetical protein [Burkholderiales bacterium]
MNVIDTRYLGCSRRAAALVATAATTLSLYMSPAMAVDGCQVLLCLAAPKWQDVPVCVPTINALMRDLSRGKPFPVCGMSGNGNTARHDWSSVPDLCPPQYAHVNLEVTPPIYSCDYAGAVSVTIDQQPFTRTWWTTGGNTVTEYFPAAKTQLGNWDTRFDDDYTAWLALQPVVDPSSVPAN